jgi:arginine decarboxylase
MAMEGMKLRMREIKDLQSIAVEHKVQKVGATFAAVVLWEKEDAG